MTAPYVDLADAGQRDPDAAAGVARLRRRVHEALVHEVRTYEDGLDDGRVDTVYLDRLCRDVHRELESVITEELAGVEEVDPLDWEVGQHAALSAELVGRHRRPRGGTCDDRRVSQRAHVVAAGRPQ